MGSYTFKWENPTGDVSDVLVTGSFDGWTKSVKLEKQGTSFHKTVTFAEKDASSKIYYKFVVDNNWTINESYPHEADHEGNVNNFLTPDDLSNSESAQVPALAADPFINTVTPESTTVAEMAKKNNNKKKAAAASKQPAAAATAVATAPASEPKPETNVAEAAPAAAEATATPSDVPGGFPVTPSNEAADLEDKTVSINPLPATVPGTSNPIKLAPGEKIPEQIAAQNINEHVKLDKESYERSDALPGGPPFSTTEVPPKSGTMIPESSLPMGDQADVTNATINSVGPGATTAALAGQVPLEPKVPEVVKESQEKAGVAPEASGVAEEVKEKAKVEEEIKAKIPEAPATSVGTSGIGTEKKENTGAILGAATATGGAAVAAAVAAVNKFSEDATPAVNDAKKATVDTINKNLPATVKDKLPEPAQAALASDKKDSPLEKISPEVPKEVKESIAEAGKSPEAAVSTSAVQEKKEVESELLKEVRKAPAVDEVKKAPALDDVVKPAETKAPETKPIVATPAAASTQAPTTVAAANGATGAETKASEPPAATPATPATNGNGTESKPAAEGGAAHDKKKSRLSVMFSKLKAKLK
ncbi:carbohydrate-binding module family 48 protein [Metarhizium guizhouense ARSEF 977]|uniref:Carbohydrate-binding module family 48 protein n=1 Tax=Metarhizium guizhouense (strain ARSEF 977) TaxID=1276136 RepID=A0A0B4GLE9_METGA|nr:carbohydrate-binding module family 48 protein [Metarhizium guizhouense ARSEF 977]